MSMLARWNEVRSQYETLEDFLSWCEQAYGLQFDYHRAALGVPMDRQKLLQAYFHLDPVQLDLEREALLEQQRTQLASPVPGAERDRARYASSRQP